MKSLLSQSEMTGGASSFSPLPDPWETPVEQGQSALPQTWLVPLDTSHELISAPAPEEIMPAGVPGAIQLNEGIPGEPNAIAILLQNELHLREPLEAPLPTAIEEAIAYSLLGT